MAKAIVRRDVGGIRLELPIDVGRNDLRTVHIGINLTSAPRDVFNNPVACFRLREALKHLLTDDIKVKYGQGTHTAETCSLDDLLADVIIEKARETQ